MDLSGARLFMLGLTVTLVAGSAVATAYYVSLGTAQGPGLPPEAAPRDASPVPVDARDATPDDGGPRDSTATDGAGGGTTAPHAPTPVTKPPAAPVSRPPVKVNLTNRTHTNATQNSSTSSGSNGSSTSSGSTSGAGSGSGSGSGSDSNLVDTSQLPTDTPPTEGGTSGLTDLVPAPPDAAGSVPDVTIDNAPVDPSSTESTTTALVNDTVPSSDNVSTPAAPSTNPSNVPLPGLHVL